MKDSIRIHISTLSRIQAAIQLDQLRTEINKGLLCALDHAEEALAYNRKAVEVGFDKAALNIIIQPKTV